MEQKLKELVSNYINVPGDQITAETVIDRSKVSSSIVLHRMYAKLAENGYKVDNYWNIKTFGNLVKQNNGEVAAAQPQEKAVSFATSENGLSTGIDIEEIAAMPVVDDFRENAFYRMNFSTSEISYCILQSNPYASFAGLFALKEAIVKCDNALKNRQLNTISISNTALGKPTFGNLEVSISHTDKFAIAIAIGVSKEYFQAGTTIAETPAQMPAVVKRPANVVAWLAILVSIVSLVLTLFYINHL